MGDRPILIAVTPDGRADAVHRGKDDVQYFVEPWVETMTMKEFIERIGKNTAESYYLQSQNGNLFSTEFLSTREPDSNEGDAASEFVPLQPDVPAEISWCSEALGKTPEAVNLWIGNNKSITSVHSDPYENIYTVIRGSKKFTLIPPTDGWCLNEKFYPHAQFSRSSPDAELEILPSPPGGPPVRWSSLPDRELDDALPVDVKPIHIDLKPGQTLYLPVGWWHQVYQSEETTIALNWWYDTETRGLSWAVLSTLREMAKVENNRQ
ncbi:Clavaminate synthase-like protein [Coprinopsis marcescibilis]|uniref:Clavaminate synthase-like protein n=1 Tax=Coprinopsis marcescibilis TaxID=230819 RepID=A0A5C3L7S0_COPMA|nr:Clavaminate synthase-like protein [Coprinopsis marcescibilis]